MQLLCSPDPSIMARKRNTTVSDRLLWTLVFCCCCLLWLRNTKIYTQMESNTKGRKISRVTKFPHSEEPSVLTSGLHIEESGSEHFPKHNQSILKQRRIIPQRYLMSRPLNFLLLCQHQLLPPAILWKTPMISFLFYCYLSWIQLWF